MRRTFPRSCAEAHRRAASMVCPRSLRRRPGRPETKPRVVYNRVVERGCRFGGTVIEPWILGPGSTVRPPAGCLRTRQVFSRAARDVNETETESQFVPRSVAPTDCLSQVPFHPRCPWRSARGRRAQTETSGMFRPPLAVARGREATVASDVHAAAASIAGREVHPGDAAHSGWLRARPRQMPCGIIDVPPHRGSGGTGRRASLRSLWGKPRGGSNPPFRTSHRTAPVAPCIEPVDPAPGSFSVGRGLAVPPISFNFRSSSRPTNLAGVHHIRLADRTPVVPGRRRSQSTAARDLR